MTSSRHDRDRGFTLVELLVVMAIIAILAAILVPAIRSAITSAKINRIAQEISQLHSAVEAYKQKFGDYPPDFSTIQKVSDLSDANNIVVRHLRRAFPRHTENLANVFAPGGTLSVPDPSEALVFWLSQLKNDPRLPLSSTTQDKHIFFEFKEDQLKDLDSDNWYSYVPRDGKDVPYVYFDNRTYQFTYSGAVAWASYTYGSTTTVCAYGSATTGAFANPKTFQIISAGLDGDFGNTVTGKTGPSYKVFPTGTNYELGDMDNITNFSDGRVLGDHMP